MCTIYTIHSLVYSTYLRCSLIPRPIPSFSMLHAEMWEVCNIEKLGIVNRLGDNVACVVQMHVFQHNYCSVDCNASLTCHILYVSQLVIDNCVFFPPSFVCRHPSWSGWGIRRPHLPADHRQWPCHQPCCFSAWSLCSSRSQRTKVCT